MAKVKVLDQGLHETRGIKYHPKYGLTSRVVQGSGFSRKAGLKYTYINQNKEGTTNKLTWGDK